MKEIVGGELQFPFPEAPLNLNQEDNQVNDSASGVSNTSRSQQVSPVSARSTPVPNEDSIAEVVRRKLKYLQYDIPVYVDIDGSFIDVDVVAVHKAKKKVKKWLEASSEYLGTSGGSEGPTEDCDETSKFPLYGLLKDLGYKKAPNAGYQSYSVFEMQLYVTLKMLPGEGGELTVQYADNGVDLPEKFSGASCSSSSADDIQVDASLLMLN